MKKSLAQNFDELVASFEKLPGVGKKSALKYAYFVGVENSFAGLNLAHCIEEAVKNLRRCVSCGGICESEICEVCADFGRNRDKICIVESPKDIFIFVLDDVNEQILSRLEKMIDENGSDELIFALTPSVNSDGIMLYIEDKLKHKSVKFSKIAQGIPTNVSLENVDMLSLIKAMNGRVGI